MPLILLRYFLRVPAAVVVFGLANRLDDSFFNNFGAKEI